MMMQLVIIRGHVGAHRLTDRREKRQKSKIDDRDACRNRDHVDDDANPGRDKFSQGGDNYCRQEQHENNTGAHRQSVLNLVRYGKGGTYAERG